MPQEASTNFRLLRVNAPRHPRRPLALGDLSRSRAQNHGGLFHFRASQAMAIKFEKNRKRRECNPFVPIHKGMVSQQRPGQRGAQLRYDSCLAIRFQVSRPADGGLQGILVPDPGKPSVALNQASMHISQHIRSNKLKAHFASSR